jgi:hypothetical protein
MTSTKEPPTYEKLISLFKFYQKVLDYLKKQNKDRQILLTDNTKTDEKLITVGKAITIVTGRVNYLAENICSLLNSEMRRDILISFMINFVPPASIDDDQTLSCLGRLALNNGDRDFANKYFEKVKDSNLKTVNQGYIAYFDNKFEEALKCFKGPYAPPVDNIKLHMGEFTSDLSDKPAAISKPTLDSISQWPAQPKIQK